MWRVRMLRNRQKLLIVFVAVMLPQSVSARTWYIKADGTGDAPFIWSGIDSAVAGDTVLVGPGTYQVGSMEMKDGVILRSEAGPYLTKLNPTPDLPPTGIACQQLVDPRTEISGFWFDGFPDPAGLGTIWIRNCFNLHITNNILTNNQVGIVLSSAGGSNFVYVENNTMVGNVGFGIVGSLNGIFQNNIVWDRALNVDAFVVVRCNDFLDLSDTRWFGINFQADPQFCGAAADNYFLQGDSPCAAGQSPLGAQCGLIGALPVGCSTTPVENKTWGAIKALYRG